MDIKKLTERSEFDFKLNAIKREKYITEQNQNLRRKKTHNIPK